jgi:hypothetical protein
MPRFEFKPPEIRDTTIRTLRPGMLASEIPSGRNKWWVMAWAYKEAAERLSAQMRDGRNEILATPMMFLYRHYIELHLKSLLLDAGELLDDPQSIEPRHHLYSLWKRVSELLLRVSPNSEGPVWDRADAIIKDFDQHDPRSFAFRYPVNNEGQASFTDELWIDPQNVTDMIAELDLILEGATAMISEYMGLKHEGY